MLHKYNTVETLLLATACCALVLIVAVLAGSLLGF